jgi:hypothetical protein
VQRRETPEHICGVKGIEKVQEEWGLENQNSEQIAKNHVFNLLPL